MQSLRHGCAFALFLALFVLAGAVVAQEGAPDGCAVRVDTASGPVCGLVVGEGDPVQVFLGIPYAEAPTGDLRWRAPVPRSPWVEPRAATSFGDRCPQNQGLEVAETSGVSEDCLSLNVWTPGGVGADGGGRPVFVFVHGGAFVIGGSNAELAPGGPYLFDGARLAQSQDLVVVTLNYRLGALGFLAGLDGIDGNFGLLDQRLALEWVRANAAVFGGDPLRITLVGNSAGAASVAAHLTAMPESARLFQSAILQSHPASIPLKDLEQAGDVARLFAFAAGCGARADTVSCLREAPVERLLAAQASPLLALNALDLGIDGLLVWSPTLDGRVVVDDPFRAAQASGVAKPLLLGTNADEGYLFAYGGGRRMGRLAFATAVGTLLGADAAELLSATVAPGLAADHRDAFVTFAGDYLFRCPNLALARTGRAPTYVYEFDHVPSFNLYEDLPVCADASCHADELVFVFGTAADPKPFTEAERVLSDQMMAAWGAFARAPFLMSVADLGDGLLWPTFGTRGERVLAWSVDAGVRDATVDRCDLYDAIGYGSTVVLEALPDRP
jgi:carboxylesterase type B